MIDGSMWPLAAWSVYGQPVRTNNVVEWWHYRLNQRAQGGTLNMYKLFGLLHKEAKMVMVMQWLLSDHKVRRSQCKAAAANEAKVFKYWQQYEDDGNDEKKNEIE